MPYWKKWTTRIRPLEFVWQHQPSQITSELFTTRRVNFHLFRPLPVRSDKFHPFRPPVSLPWGATRCHSFASTFLHIYEWTSLRFSNYVRRWRESLSIVFPVRFRHSSHETRGRLASSLNFVLRKSSSYKSGQTQVLPLGWIQAPFRKTTQKLVCVLSGKISWTCYLSQKLGCRLRTPLNL